MKEYDLNSYSHTHHFVNEKQFNQRIEELLDSNSSEHAIPQAYQLALKKTQQLLSTKINKNQKMEIASLACGTMYDVLSANYENRDNISFCGFDIDSESLRLAQEKADSLGYKKDQVKLQECDVIDVSLPEEQYDAIVCNGFSFYVEDKPLSELIENVKKALKPNGIFIMSFIQPTSKWQMNEKEKEVSQIVQKIFDALPNKWSANLRTQAEILSLMQKSGLNDVSIWEENHQIHPLSIAKKQ